MASYSVLITCCPLPWCVSSPAQCGCGWYFYCGGHRPRLFLGSAICLPSGHWRLFPAHTIQGHIPCPAQRPLVWAYVCALAQASLPPFPSPHPLRGLWHQTVCQNAPQERGWCGCPVVCPQVCLCSALVLGALLLRPCALSGNAVHALAHSVIRSVPSYWTPAVCHSALSPRSSDSNGNTNKAKDHYNLVRRETKMVHNLL